MSKGSGDVLDATLVSRAINGWFPSFPRSSGEMFSNLELEEGASIFMPSPSRGAFPFLRLLVVALGETQLFSGNASGRLDSCNMADFGQFSTSQPNKDMISSAT